jgi:hypothetical protein
MDLEHRIRKLSEESERMRSEMLHVRKALIEVQHALNRLSYKADEETRTALRMVVANMGAAMTQIRSV